MTAPVSDLRLSELLELEQEAMRLRQALEESEQLRESWRASLEELERKRKLLSLAVEQSASAVLITDPSGVIQYVNPRFTSNTGYSAEEAIGQTPALLSSGLTSDSVYKDLWSTIRSGKAWYGEMLNRNKDGSESWTYLSISPMADDAGTITNFVAVSEDVSELKRAAQKMTKMALYDGLTDLPNRRLFTERVGQAIREAQRSGEQLGLMFVDLDHFKRINDTHGHEVGDTVLQAVGDRLQSILRESDTIGRFGGDEFLVLLPALRNEVSLRQVASKILRALRVPVPTSKGPLRISASVGITIGPADGEDAASLMRNADLAMYRAKQQGRDTCHFYSEALHRELQARAKIETALSRAIELNQLSLALQPIFDVRKLEVVSAEALLRWQTPELGPVRPDVFIEIAEESGLILDLGNWVLDRACAHGQALREQTGRDISIAVNVSPRQLQHPGFAMQVERVLAQHGLPAELLHIEVTENLLMDDIELSTRCLRRLKDLGLAISVDDFGTGHSSLAYLKKLPLDVLKVDKTFVQNTPEDRANADITSAVVAMAHKLDLKVVAEGVERPQELDFLRDNDCDLVQGYLTGRPGTFEALTAHVDEADSRSA